MKLALIIAVCNISLGPDTHGPPSRDLTRPVNYQRDWMANDGIRRIRAASTPVFQTAESDFAGSPLPAGTRHARPVLVPRNGWKAPTPLELSCAIAVLAASGTSGSAPKVSSFDPGCPPATIFNV